MRDLDQLQEQDPEQRRRNLATLLVLGTVLLGLFGAVLSHWSRASGRTLADADSLELLGSNRQGSQTAPAETRSPAAVPLDASKLTFERALTGREDRPEVLAALEAAVREANQITRPRGEGRVMAATHTAGAAKEAAREPSKLLVAVPSATIPASMAASSAGQKLERAARHDKLVAAAMQKPGKGHMHTGSGSDGGFLLHVISYDTRAPAEALVSSLRDKGHEAFVAAGEVDGRGRYYRVRIGPFPSKPAAEAYRRDFAAHERMNTIVVRRDETQD